MDITLNTKQLKKLTDEWVGYFVERPEKLFQHDEKFPNTDECLSLIAKSNGFQITAFAGKVQNSFSHQDRLPDLGDLNLLARLRAIQILANKPLRIIFDGEFYADIFDEELHYITKYEAKLTEYSKLIELNKEFDSSATFYTVPELLKLTGHSMKDLESRIEYYTENPLEAYKLVETRPHELSNKISRLIKDNGHKYTNDDVLEIGSKFIIKKAALAEIIEVLHESDNYQRITILKYSKSNNPRIRTEMKYAPWNATILFKGSYLNINTATSGSFEEFKNDKRNFQIYNEDKTFLGFTRKPHIFENL
ncbi:hypothetical protein KC909_01345 [Candidatus Dojkabacteria bacterium]|uniref:Uncharacterized protein n=1 Tax=Candidatus Dojkabacteria bacterium TaxID=2099670 RepID=A0A955L4S0_9BACT|nr:hypothetical protein [Candidatus Dojkabacteria bacterium]